MSDVVLAVDLGTSGVRVALVDTEARVLGSATRPVAMQIGPGAAAEQDPEAIWRAFGSAVQTALA